MRLRVRGQSWHKVMNVPWRKAYYWVGYNSKTNKLSNRLRKLRNKKKAW